MVSAPDGNPDLLTVDPERGGSYVGPMSTRQQVPGGWGSDACAEVRAAVDARCEESHAATQAHALVVERVRALKRDLVAAEHRRDEAVAADDPRMRAAEKTAARDTYQMARTAAETDDEVREATAAWAKALDRINRTGTLRRREVAKAEAAVTTLESVLRSTVREEQTVRLHADQAEAACME